MLAAGLLMGAAVFGLYLLAARFFASSVAPAITLPAGMIALTGVYFLANGFGEELAFRAYLQGRLSERFSPVVGVVLAAALFVPLHMLVARLSALEVLSGLALWIAIGALYSRTRSLYLVGALHAALNILPAVFNTALPAQGMLAVHLVLLAGVLAFLRRA
jgi:membrane protease YdiL (CAAX protease family)